MRFTTKAYLPYLSLRRRRFTPVEFFVPSLHMQIFGSQFTILHSPISLSHTTMIFNKSTVLALLAISSFASAADRNLRAVSRFWHAFLPPLFLSVICTHNTIAPSITLCPFPGSRLDRVPHFWSCNQLNMHCSCRCKWHWHRNLHTSWHCEFIFGNARLGLVRPKWLLQHPM